ncbi:carbon-nitrogen hydrolase family protein [Halobacterium litoreum]|uniref:Carbon-nitrogen hydrolase family protein n=1 Tax=Halobacterium litoreum TaxID=2039234 RepID=A0ABD5NAM8_9EURY|nr:carbon-nitrogen hydrolase family protein [Halobacterium litoreum]UHH12036.1 carbon-nitrogen hydrolase family protein [Halobacterium litoreum]
MPDPTVAACQTDLTDLDPAANLATVGERLAALDDGVDVALFPEYALTGFVADDRVHDAALDRDGDELARLATYADDHDTAILAGFVEAGDDAHYNTVAYVTPDGDRTFYRKRNLWAGEASVLATGDDAVTVDTPAGETGLVTCYDLNFVDVSAEFARERVDALFVVGAWPGAYSENWRLLLRARALDGVRWVVGCGRTGRRDLPDSPAVDYAGRSAVVRPDGAVSAALNRDERTLVADLDSDVLAEQREFIPVLAEE